MSATVSPPAPTPGGTSAGAAPRVLYLVGTSHLDTQWRWTVRDTIRTFLPRTLAENFRLFERLPEFVLSFEGAFRYMLMREYYPEEFARLARRVADGRWAIAGSMLEAPDVNLPSPESLVRHVLYGRRFFERHFDRWGVDVFLPDCFGFGAALPSIAAHCGLSGLSTSKLVKWKAPDRAPFELGRWRGPDGAEILAALHPEGYGEGLSEDLGHAERWRRRIERLESATGVGVAMMYVGVGDRGGALDSKSVGWLERSLRGGGPVTVRMAASDQLFRDLGPDERARLPAYEGELLLPTHGSGCLTSQAVMKRWNRANELLADAAERAAVAADWLGGQPYPAARLREGWLRFLWHQMHDDLTGTSIPAAYRISWNDQLVARNLLAGVLADAVGAVARALDTRVEGIPLLVYNPLSIARDDLVEAAVRFPGTAPAAVRVLDADGREVACQCGPPRGDRLTVVFRARVGPVGFALFEVRGADAAAARDPELETAPHGIANRHYLVELDGRGDLARLCDRATGRELLAAPARLELLPDRSSKWPAWEVRYEDVVAPPRPVGSTAELRIVEQGPARVTLEARRRAARSTFVQRYRLAAGDAGRRLEVDCSVEWRTRGRMLKAAFQVPFARPEASYDLGLGVVRRPPNRREKYEVPAQQWADLSGDGAGLSILEDCKYGWDRPDAVTLRLTLLRSPRVRRRFRHQGFQDHGPHRFRYALFAHDGDWAAAGTGWQAARLNQPLLAFQVPRRPGPLGRRLSLLECEPAAVAVRALKRGEAGADTVVRLQETTGESVPEVRLAGAGAILEAREVDGCETAVGEATTDGRLLTRLGAFQPRAFALRLEPPAAAPPPPRGRPLELPYDLPAASFHGQRRGPDFDGRGRSLPGELLPAEIEAGGIVLRLGPRVPGARNCVACAGQSLPGGGDFDRLVLLAAAVGGDAVGELVVGGHPVPIEVRDWTRPVGQWVRRRWLWGTPVGPSRPPYEDRDVIAWLGSHRHDARVRDEAYRFCYLYRYVVELPAEGAPIRLPANPRIRLFAATLAADANFDARPASAP